MRPLWRRIWRRRAGCSSSGSPGEWSCPGTRSRRATTTNRAADFRTSGLSSRPLPDLYLLQIAYPIVEKWLDELDDCGLVRLATLQQRTILVRARGLSELLGCPAARYFSWIDSYRTTDRVQPAMLREEAPLGYTLHFAPGTDLAEKASRLTGNARAVGLAPAQNGNLPALQLQATRVELQTLVMDDPDLLSVTYRGILAVSDERQGQIVAGNYNANGTLTTPGYRAWLNSRGLLSDTNQQVVGMIDSGYEDGSLAGNHNPDLKNPYRLVAPVKLPPNSSRGADSVGHGTMVAGIIAGEGASGLGAGGLDPQGFLYGSGISPKSKLVAAMLPTGSSLSTPSTLAYLKEAVAFCRNDPASGADRAWIVNNSYNSFFVDELGTNLAVNQYDEGAQAFDSLTLDGNQGKAGLQPTLIVFSSGNYAYDYTTGNVRVDSVSSPATAKNVITVGATTSYRPVPQPPLPCAPNPNGSRPPDQDAPSIFGLGLFSGNGLFFSASSGPRLHKVRVKPDLVAPGVRVFSTVPFNPTFYTRFVGCLKYYPDPTDVYHHTYGTGTSFSAPVVSGVAALARKWFLDRGLDPSPSLLKAALIATAEEAGVGDRRPSFRSGWGRVSLNRLTRPDVERFYSDAAAPVSTGQSRTWTRTVSDPGKDTYIVLVWADPPSDVPGSSQAPLKNDLSLTAEETIGGFPLWRGNNFRENNVGVDNGYSHRFLSASDPGLVDAINTVEAIFIPANTLPAGQKLTIKVRGENVMSAPQSFAVYAWNIKLSS